MCSPTMALSAALSVGSMMMQNKAQNQVVSARNSALGNGLAKQSQHQAQAALLNENTQQNFTREAQDRSLAQENARRTVALQSSVGLPQNDSVLPTDPSAPKIIESQLGKRIGDALSYGKDMAAKNATLGSFGANQFNNGILLGHASQNLGQVGNFAGGDANVSNAQLDAASSAGDKSAGIADLFRLGASGVSAYGMMGGGLGAPKAASPYALATGPTTTFGGKPAGIGMRF